MGILDYLILAGIAVGILAAVRHLKRNSGCGGIFFSEDFYGISARGKEGYFSFLCALLFFTEKQAEKICNFSQINIFSQ